MMGLALLLTGVLAGCSEGDTALSDTPEITPENTSLVQEIPEEDAESWGSVSALDAVDYTLEEMLIYAIQDEYTARSEYEYLIETFAIDKPFTNIMASEEKHIAMLVPLFTTYAIPLTDDTSAEHLIPIASLEEAFAIGVEAEILNIAMYNAFLTQDLPDDIEATFIKLRDASENHLAAFEKNLQRITQ